MNGTNELTPREREVMDLVAQGKTNIEIGRALYLSEHTVRNYLKEIFEKLNVRNRTEAAVKYLGVLER